MPDTNNSFPAVTVIMPNYHDENGVENCLNLLKQQDYKGTYSIIVVDNSEQYSLKNLEGKFPATQFLWEETPGSYNARNKALKIVKTPLVVFIDSDCSPHTNWISNGVQCLLSNPMVGKVGGKIQIQPVNVDAPTLAEYSEIINGFPQQRYVEVENFAATANAFTTLLVIEKVGQFNGALKSGGDHEWGNRVFDAGYKIDYCAGAVVDHPARIHSEIIKKLKRTVSGARDRNPSWASCLKFVIRYLIPPRKKIINIWKFDHKDIGFSKKLNLTLYAVYINCLTAYYRLKMQLFETSSPR